MLRTPQRSQSGSRENGQVLVIFAAGLVVFLGFVAMSIDVGRYVWARTQMQAAVDAASLAAAASMPISTGEANAKANEYWIANIGFIQAQGTNVALTVTFPEGNKAVKLKGDADIPTWFARLFGINEWHVTAEGTAASQVLDIAVVLDVSGSMCFDSNIPADGEGPGKLMGPGRGAVAGGWLRPTVATAIPAGTAASGYVITLNDVDIFNDTNATNNRSNFGTWFPNSGSNRYWNYDPDGGGVQRAGLIKIDNELMRITALNAAANQLTVSRAQVNLDTNATIPQAAHAVGARVEFFIATTGMANYCDRAAPFAASTTVNGPHAPFDGMITNAKYFVSLFNSSYDKIGIASYSTTAANQNGLTNSFSTINSKLDGSGAPAFLFPNGGTNIAHGLAVGRHILDGPGKRPNAVRVLVILTDGVPNQYCSNASAYSTPGASCTSASATTPSTCPASSTGITHSINQAQAAKDAGIIVFTIGLGGGVLDCILQDIATTGGGTYYAAPTTAQLDEAFAAIAAQTHIALTQ